MGFGCWFRATARGRVEEMSNVVVVVLPPCPSAVVDEAAVGCVQSTWPGKVNTENGLKKHMFLMSTLSGCTTFLGMYGLLKDVTNNDTRCP